VSVGKARRPKGDGSYVHRADGLWQYAIDLGKDADGRRQRRYIYARSKGELSRKVADLRSSSGGSIRPRAAGTVGEWVETWLNDEVKPTRSRNTYALYESVWRVHVKPVLENLKLEDLDAAHVARLYSILRTAGASATIVHRCGVLMQRAITVATKRGVFHKANPFALVEKPTPRPKEQHLLTVAEARRILAASRDDRLEGVFVLLLTAGLRLGEALAIEWRDVDFEHRRLAVRRTLTEVNGVTELGPPKTPGSRRAVELGRMAIDALRRRKVAAAAEAHSSQLVFTTSVGTPLRRSNVRGRHFEPILERARVEGVTLHGLRHAHVSFGIAEGIAPKVLAERLGHVSVRMTEDRYAHVLPGLQRAAADAIDAALAAPKKAARKTPSRSRGASK
jgi:integrase